MKKYAFHAAVLAVAGLSMMALPAYSVENYDGMGEVTATIDGKSYSAITLSETSNHTASAIFQAIGGMTRVSIQGHDLDTGDIMDNVLNLEISLMGTDASARILDAGITYWPEGMNGPFYTSDETGHHVSVSWEELSFGDDAMAKGSFETTLCRQEGFFSEVDTNNCMDITGRFETGLEENDIDI